MLAADPDPRTALARLVNGYQVSQAIHAAVRLGVPDLLAAGARTSDDLAEAAGADAATLHRLLRALASLGVLHEQEGRRFALTPLGEHLRSDVPGSLHGWAAFVGRDYYWQTWGDLVQAVRTGQSAFRQRHGMDVWEYRAARPEESAIFDRAMTSLAHGSLQSFLDGVDLARFGTVVDVGGGRGTLIAAVLRAHPGMRGVLFDQPHVVAGASPVLEAAGVADRCAVVGGSFFEEVPAGGDAYVLKQVIHDWDDEEALAILRTVRAAARPGAAVLLLERDLGGPNDNPQAKLSDLNMLVMLGARERSVDEYAALFDAAGFDYVGVALLAAGQAALEGVAR